MTVSALDRTVARASMRLATGFSRRSFLGRSAAVMGAATIGSGLSAAFAPKAFATHGNESIFCKYHPGIGSMYCPYCRGGCWTECDPSFCGNRAVKICDCCSGNCSSHTHPDPTDPNGVGWSCRYSGYCGSGCSGQKVVCRYTTSCTQILC